MSITLKKAPRWGLFTLHQSCLKLLLNEFFNLQFYIIPIVEFEQVSAWRKVGNINAEIIPKTRCFFQHSAIDITNLHQQWFTKFFLSMYINGSGNRVGIYLYKVFYNWGTTSWIFIEGKSKQCVVTQTKNFSSIFSRTISHLLRRRVRRAAAGVYPAG